MKYVKPTTNGENFTAGKLYEVLFSYGENQVEVRNDKGKKQIVNIGDKGSLRLRGGKFNLVEFPTIEEAVKHVTASVLRTECKPGGTIYNAARESDHLKAARQIADNAAKLVAQFAYPKNGYFLNSKGQLEQWKDGELVVTIGNVDATAVKGEGWRVHNAGMQITSGNFKPSELTVALNGKQYTESQIAKLEKEAEQHKADCIKAEAVIDQLYDMFPQVRNAEQLIAAVKSAKIFSDAFLELQKVK
ncbi:hypothetical protein KMB85_gp18 [Escherichia phage vB_EcoS_W011D]|uniref:Uncharacterized protein n=1 Tax=Escherichia phage vB_EcoS_W011D TaxID=2575323 RepID=A0A4Y5NU81_9CAUD|nr:hypothetical protein KMB85_gp18 [Escherichia phage vB_EcoS_W011D]QCW18467.1 hypothetical protein vBEcoSW011D_18 [Escherichia phage vB_EcoS_W011D]